MAFIRNFIKKIYKKCVSLLEVLTRDSVFLEDFFQKGQRQNIRQLSSEEWYFGEKFAFYPGIYGIYFHWRTFAPKACFSFWGSQTGPAVFSQDAMRQTKYGIPMPFGYFMMKEYTVGSPGPLFFLRGGWLGYYSKFAYNCKEHFTRKQVRLFVLKALILSNVLWL